MNRVLISGGTGLIGSRLVESLREAGAEIRLLSRRANLATNAFESKVEILKWDGVHLPDGALQDCTSVIHLAGEPIFGGPLTSKRRRSILHSRIDSTRSIVEALRAAPDAKRPSTFVCGSAVGFYGSRGEELLDESAAPGTGFLSNVCQQWEATARAAAAPGLRVVSLRTGIVLSRRGGALPLMALPFRFGLGGRLGCGRQWVPWIQIDDAVRLICTTLKDQTIEGPVNLVAPNPVRNAELTTALAGTLRRPAILPAPAFALRLALGDLSEELLGSRRCVARTAAERGFQFTHSEIETALEIELG